MNDSAADPDKQILLSVGLTDIGRGADLVARYRWRRLASRLVDAARRRDLKTQRELVKNASDWIASLKKNGWPGRTLVDMSLEKSIAAVGDALDEHDRYVEELLASGDLAPPIAAPKSEPELTIADGIAEKQAPLGKLFEALNAMLSPVTEIRNPKYKGPLAALLAEVEANLPKEGAGRHSVARIAAALLFCAKEAAPWDHAALIEQLEAATPAKPSP